MFSIDDVACQASDLNHIVKNASSHRNVCRFIAYSPSILSIVSTPPFVLLWYFIISGLANCVSSTSPDIDIDDKSTTAFFFFSTYEQTVASRW